MRRSSELPAVRQRRHVPGRHAGRACREGDRRVRPASDDHGDERAGLRCGDAGQSRFRLRDRHARPHPVGGRVPRCARQRPASRQRGALPAPPRDPRTRGRGSRWRPSHSDRRDRNRRRRSPNGTRRSGRWPDFRGRGRSHGPRSAAFKAAGADIVVALAHSGLGEGACGERRNARRVDAPSGNGAENVARAIAALPGCGRRGRGPHARGLPRRLRPRHRSAERPIVQPGFWGSHLGCIDSPCQADAGPRMAGLVDAESPCRGGAHERRPARRGRGAAPRPARTSGLAEDGRQDAPLRPIGSPPEDRGKRRRTPDVFQHRCPMPRDAACLGRTARGRAQGDRGSWRTWTVCRSCRPSHPCAARCPTSTPTSRRVRSCCGMSRTSIAIPIRSPSCGSGADLSDWLERSASIYHGSIRTTLRHNRSSTTASPATISTGSTGCSMTSTSAARPDRCPRRPDLRHARTHPEPALTPTDARSTRRRKLWSSRIPTARRAAAVSPPAPAAKRSSMTRLVRDHIVDFIRAHCGPIRPEPSASFRLCGFGVARPVVETGAGAMHHADQLPSLGLVPLGPGTEVSGPPCATGTCASNFGIVTGHCISA
jgi:2',3'-cyclic-nucleotide 2'-phosphodiesterase/3'-nucleotidase